MAAENFDPNKVNFLDHEMPTEIILKLLFFLDPKSLAQFQRVNRRARQLVEDESLWRGFLIPEAKIPKGKTAKQVFISNLWQRKLAYLDCDADGIKYKKQLNQLEHPEAASPNWQTLYCATE